MSLAEIDIEVRAFAERITQQYSPAALRATAREDRLAGCDGLADTKIRLAKRLERDPRIEAVRQLLGHADAANDGTRIFWLNKYLRSIKEEIKHACA